jgi:2-phosphosulfolactate phosphatase
MTAAERVVTVTCFHGDRNGCVATGRNALVAVDVIRATTTAVTAVALGRKCFPVATLEEATSLAAKLDGALTAGELGGNMPHGFDLTNSPAALEKRDDISRPMILLSTSGTHLICAARGNVYLGCLRNHGALVDYLADHHENVIVVGAGTRGEFREEDRLCSAWIAHGLVKRGYSVTDARTQDLLNRWGDRGADSFVGGKSTDYLRETGQLADLRFILDHVNDLDCIVHRTGEEVTSVAAGAGYRLTFVRPC